MNEALVGPRQFLTNAARRLAEAGVSDPAREAAALWAAVTGRDPAAPLMGNSTPVLPAEARGFAGALERRLRGEPLAHVVGLAGFRHLLLRCDRRALIPRPETEGLVDLVLARTREGRVLDVGTGTGCIALSLAQEGNYQLVAGVEFSAAALALAAENVRMTGLAVRLFRGNLCEGIGPGSFDVLVANPPYLTDREYGVLDRSVKEWEPAEALASGADGLEASRRLLRAGLKVVRPGGLLALEVDCSRAAAAGHEAREAGWEGVALLDDLFGRARYLIARRGEWN